MNQQESEKMSRELQCSTYEDIVEAFLMCSLHKLWSLYNWWCFKQFHDQGLDWVISFVPLQLNDPV